MARQRHRETPPTRRQFSQTFKLEAVQLLESGAKSQQQLAHELGVRPDMLRRWRREVQARTGRPPTEIFPGAGRLASAEAELYRLRREVTQLREEREILKKAAAFFARESR